MRIFSRLLCLLIINSLCDCKPVVVITTTSPVIRTMNAYELAKEKLDKNDIGKEDLLAAAAQMQDDIASTASSITPEPNSLSSTTSKSNLNKSQSPDPTTVEDSQTRTSLSNVNAPLLMVDATPLAMIEITTTTKKVHTLPPSIILASERAAFPATFAHKPLARINLDDQFEMKTTKNTKNNMMLSPNSSTFIISAVVICISSIVGTVVLVSTIVYVLRGRHIHQFSSQEEIIPSLSEDLCSSPVTTELKNFKILPGRLAL